MKLKLKLLVHGRKNGYTVLYPKPTPSKFYSFASDIQSINANNYAIYYGKSFYTLAFVTDGCIFTKYVIGDDVERGQLGEIGISVFIPHTHKLSGTDVKDLLDDLISLYARKYIPNDKIVEPKSGFIWEEFVSLALKYEDKLDISPDSYDADNVATGTKDPAFHYYDSDSELIEHLDKPFQEEYSDYKQILFIESKYKGGKADPLNVLKNSGKEVNPDFKNNYFYLVNYNPSKGVTITANGKLRSDKRGENQIRAESEVEIKYKKKYFKPILASGSIANRESSGIDKYLEIKNERNIIIKYDAFQPDEESRTFIFKVIKDKGGAPVYNAEIKVDNEPWELRSSVTFKGEALGQEHKISAQKGKSLFIEEEKFTPKDHPEDTITLRLIEKKPVSIKVLDSENDDIISDFSVRIPGKKFNEFENQVVFISDEIDKEWIIQIEKQNEYKKSEKKKFCPARDGDEIIFKLEKTKKNRNIVAPFNHLPDKGDGKSDNRKMTQIIKWGLIGVSVLFVLFVFAFLIWKLSPSLFERDKQTQGILANKGTIEAYVNGDSLILDTLEIYIKKWNDQEQNFITKSGGGWFGGDKEIDSTEWKKDWKPTYESLDNAIKKRKLVDTKSFAELSTQVFSNSQLSFKTIIDKIDSTKYTEVGQQLGDISTLTLTQIAGKINEILEPEEPAKIEQPQKPKKETSAKTERTKEQPKSQKPKTAAPTTQQETVSTDKIDEIIHYLRGSYLNKDKLKEYKGTKGIDPNLENSIQLCLDFWELDGLGSGNNAKTYWTFRNKINADKTFNNSKLKAFINDVCDGKLPDSYKTQDKKLGLRR